MARTIEEIQADLTIAYQVRRDLLSGKSISRASFASTESSTSYTFTEVNLDNVLAWISSLEAELQSVLYGTQDRFREGESIPMFYRKGGVSHGRW